MSELNLPKLAMGTWAWDTRNNGGGYFGDQLSASDLKPVVDRAMKNKFYLWDTATIYGDESSEKTLGELLSPYHRSDYYLSTKFSPQLAEDRDDEVSRWVDRSLNNLKTDYIDIYWIHNPTDVKKWTPQLIPLVKSGKIKHVGVSNHNLDQIKLAQQILGEAGIKLYAVQNHYSLLYRSSEQAGILDYCHQNNIKFFPYMVLEQGALTGQYDVDHPMPSGSSRAEAYNNKLAELSALISDMRQIGRRHDISVPEVAMAWAIAKGTIPIIGVTKSKYIDSGKRAEKASLTDNEINELEASARKSDVDVRAYWEQKMN